MKNNKKKGFTLVELIVVIAIMAVLAGTVAGVTVTTLHKQTDKVNADFNGRQIAEQIRQWVSEVMENNSYFYTLTNTTAQEANLFFDLRYHWEDYKDSAYTMLKNRFSDMPWSVTSGAPDKKGCFSATVKIDENSLLDSAVYLLYHGKHKDYDEVAFRIGYKNDILTVETQSNFPA